MTFFSRVRNSLFWELDFCLFVVCPVLLDVTETHEEREAGGVYLPGATKYHRPSS